MADEETASAELPEPSENNPDPEALRTAAVQQHQQTWASTDWMPQREVHGAHIVSDAVDQIGQPFLWGGNKPGGFDSQGLAKYAYQNNGIPMSHLLHNQLQHGEAVEPGQLQPGDLVFVATGSPQVPDRTGIYVGDGVMVHSSPSAGVVASRISHVGRIVSATHLQSVVRTPTKKPQPIPKGLYETDEVMPHNRISPALKESITNVAGVH